MLCHYGTLPLQLPILHPMRLQILAKFFLHHRFVIGPVADVHLRDGVPFEGDDVGADSIEEPAVVADDGGDACKFFEGWYFKYNRGK